MAAIAARVLAGRFGTLLPYKLLMAVLLNVWVCVPYFGLQHVAVFPLTPVPPCGLDRLVPFTPAAAWLYLSLFVLLPIAPALFVRGRELCRFALAVAVLALVSNLVFFFYPTGVSRPATDAPGLAYGLILATDQPVNACPSLHASLAVLSALCCTRLLRGRPFWQLLAWAWAAAILYATLATKQHVLIDLAAGAALAVLVWAGTGWLDDAADAAPAGAAPQASAAAAAARALVSAGIEPQLDALRRLDLRHRLAELACFIALWVAGAGLTLTLGLAVDDAAAWGCYALGVLLSAVAINALVLLLHDGMHHTLFRTPACNRWASVLLGAPVLMSFTAYQVMHLRHHTYLGDPRDPDDYRNRTRRRALLWAMHFLRLLCGSFLYLLLIPGLAWKYGTPRDRRRIVEEYLLLAVVATAVALTVPGAALLHGWLVPAVLVGYFTNLRGFAQHGITDADDPFLASRSIRAHPLVAFCLLYENYHLEHHFFPEVPSYHLPALHRLIWPRLPRVVTGRSYVAFLLRFLRATLTLDETPIGLHRGTGAPGPAVGRE